MPINCPACLARYNDCEGCRYNSDKHCTWTSTPVPLRDIITHEERLCILEEAFEDLRMNIPSRAFRELRKDMNNLQGQMIHLENKLNEHIDIPKKMKKKGKSKGLEIG